MKRLTLSRPCAVRGFVIAGLQFLLTPVQIAIVGGSAWYSWRASIELPKSQAELKASGYSLDPLQACAPEWPEAGNFGAVELLKGIATSDEDLTPEIKARIATIKALNITPVSAGSRAPELSGTTGIQWSAWREWIANKLKWKVPAEKDDAKAVLLALRKKTADIFPSLLKAARAAEHSSPFPSQRARISASVQRDDVILDFGIYHSRLMPLMRILLLQCEAALAAGEQKEAEDLAAVIVVMRDLTGKDASLISYLVRITVDQMLLDFAQRNIAEGRMNTWFLIQWPAILNGDNEMEAFQRAMIMERASSHYMLEHMREKNFPLDAITTFEGITGHLNKRHENPVAQKIAQVTLDLTRAGVIRDFIQEMDALKSGGLMGYYRNRKAYDDQPRPNWLEALLPDKLLVHGMRSGYGALMPGIIYKAMRRGMVPAVCALERHRLAGGVPPDSLAAMPKDLLLAIPKDLDGQPIRYRRDNDGWVLWSVGLDLKDDWNGKPPPPQQEEVKDSPWKEPDWQWRRSPAGKK